MKLVAEFLLRIHSLHIVTLKIACTHLFLQAFVKEEVSCFSFPCSSDYSWLIVVQKTLFLVVHVLHLFHEAVVLREDQARILLAEAGVDIQRFFLGRVVDCTVSIDSCLLSQVFMMSLYHYYIIFKLLI